ncbi:V-type ATP synthase subunit A [Aeropyrum camini SY1 = JCM 12091]|uniref:A-type ATP synthase subunit A n=2 Tax=Aeropyrum camini TaxID=229980 RepID=U3TCS0_9CREN|nr:ATP synthase subunit A [Aeropyrum camini]BAN89763.1 V-type ATP synthase subunit A [Aeropyrum camini SY1 = JCM 12091]
MAVKGSIVRISGPLVVAEGMSGAQMYEMVYVGEDRLIGEITRIRGDRAFIQVYESTSGLRPGEPVVGTGAPLSVELGPGLLGTIYDGVQRPLPIIAERVAEVDPRRRMFVERGVQAPPLPRDKKFHFKPEPLKEGDKVEGGDALGRVPETSLIEHVVMVPPGIRGRLKWLAGEGDYSVEDTIAVVERDGRDVEIRMHQRWPVRIPRPFKEKLEPQLPLITGVRIIDTFFPMAKGGTGAVPGGFGTGKTVTLHSLAQWSEARVVIYIGCGERGNEMTEVLERFPKYKDPWTGKPLMDRTVLIANTSNMPVAAREASIYVGITIAEYYRDMGYDVLLVADSTSRWAEALREIAGRLEEMPAEEGYPSYLASRLAEFYERAGRVKALGSPERNGSVTVVGAVSPPGGDFSEPVTSHTTRFIRVFWALDTKLAYSRHYPAINWLMSYSAYVDLVTQWWHENVDKRWREYRDEAMDILLRESELQEIVRLVGTEGLDEKDKMVLETARLIKDGFLKQNAFDPIDAFSTPQKQFRLLKMIMDIHRKSLELIERGVTTQQILQALGRLYIDIVKAKFTIPNDQLEKIDEIRDRALKTLEQLGST